MTTRITMNDLHRATQTLEDPTPCSCYYNRLNGGFCAKHGLLYAVGG